MRFLRLFPQFRAIEAELAEAASARIFAEDNSRLFRSRVEIAESERDKARDEISHCLKMVADWQAISSGQRPIFNVVPIPPPSEELEGFGPQQRPRLAREVQLDRNERARRAAYQERNLQAAEAQNHN